MAFLTDRIVRCLGLVSQYNPLSTSPGALIRANDCVIDRENTIEDRRGYANYFTLGANCRQLMVYANTIIADAGTTLSYDNSGTPANYSGSYSPVTGQKMRFAEGFQNLYVTTSAGVQVLTDRAGTAARNAGAPRSLDPSYSLNSASSGFLATDYQCAYRAIIMRTDANQNVLFGYPSTRLWVTNPGVQATGTITCAGVLAADTVTVGGIVFTAITGSATAGQFDRSGSDAQTTTNLVTAINSSTLSSILTASVSLSNSSLINLEIISPGSAGNSVTLTSSNGTRLAVAGFSGGSGTSKNIDLRLYLPAEVTVNDVIQFYRTAQISGSASDAAGDEMQLCYQYNPTSTDISNKYITFTDIVSDALRGATLYTSPSQEGIQGGNDRPPVCKDIALFRSTFMCYANTYTKQRQFLSMVGTAALGSQTTGTTTSGSNQLTGLASTQGIASGMTITGTGIPGGTTVSSIVGTTVTMSANASATGTPTVTFMTPATIKIAGTTYSFASTENAASGVIGVSLTGVPAIDIDQTARSMVRVINQYATNTSIYAYYDSGPNDAPGLMHFEERGIGAAAFTTQVSAASIQGSFSASGTIPPIIPSTSTQYTSSNQVQKNAFYISKDGQLEAVPALQYKLAGAANKEILRIVALRESLIIVKEDGIYRMTGNSLSNFDVTPLDTTVICKSADSVAVLANQAFLLSNQGVVAVSENGVQVVSREIENNLKPLLGFSNIGTLATGAGYESDRAYFLSVPTLSTDTVQNQTYRFNIFTRTWTRWSFGFNAAIVEPGTDRLFFSKPSSAIVYRERKDFQDSDYADPEFSITISAINLTANSVTFTLSSGTPQAGWSVFQGATNLVIESLTNVASTYTAVLSEPIPTSWTTGSATLYPYTGLDIEWDTWTGGPQGVGRLKQVSEVCALTDNIPGNNTASNVIITFRTNFDDIRDENPINFAGSGGWGTAQWGTSPWGASGVDDHGYRCYVPKNKQYCHLLNTGIKHFAAREKVSISGMSFLYKDISGMVGR